MTSHRPLRGVSCKNIRLSADVAKSLSRSRNWRADGDGCVGLHLMQVSCSGLRVRFARLEVAAAPVLSAARTSVSTQMWLTR